MSRDNPLWGTERIRGELLKLGLTVSNRSIRRYRWRGRERSSSQSWRTFLANHRPQIWAADLLTVQTLTFRTLYVLFFITHDRRELVHFSIRRIHTATVTCGHPHTCARAIIGTKARTRLTVDFTETDVALLGCAFLLRGCPDILHDPLLLLR